jgi:GNAT superfamily N-acetyltransferase
MLRESGTIRHNGSMDERQALLRVVAQRLVSALVDDPFYSAITVGYAEDPARRRRALAAYFEYSLEEGERLGSTVLDRATRAGAAVWLMPVDAPIAAAAEEAKRAFLQECLGPVGLARYDAILAFMGHSTEPHVPARAWYLSILGVDPGSQGHGLGAALLAGTLAEATSSGAHCYLETFSSATLKFYGRLGFAERARYREPVTEASYWVLVRPPEVGLLPADGAP